MPSNLKKLISIFIIYKVKKKSSRETHYLIYVYIYIYLP